MDRSSVIKLISVVYSTDEIGQKVAAETEREVFCSVDSVTRTEWANAGILGLKPQYKVTMFAPDYQGEELCSLDSVRYSVYRTYRLNEDSIELYLEKKTGV